MPGLHAEITANASQMRREFTDVERMAERAGVKIQQNVNGHGPGGIRSGAMRETLVLMREIGRGNWSRVPGSFSLLISQLGLLPYLLNPITGILAGIGVGAFFVARHFMKLNEEAKNFKELMDTSEIKFSEQASALRKAAEEAQNFHDWLKKLAESQQELGDQTEEALKSLREQAKFERELASQNGASRKQLADMDIASAKKELDYVLAARVTAEKKYADDNVAAIQAERSANNPEREGKLKLLGEKSSEAGKIVDAIMQKMKTEVVNTMVNNPLMPGTVGISSRPVNESDLIDVEVDGKKFGMSLKQAREAFDTLTREENELAATQRELNDLVQSKKKLSEEDLQTVKRLKKKSEEIDSDIQLKSKYLPQLAEGTKANHGHVNALQQIGGYAPAAQLIDVNKKQLHHLASIDGKMGNKGSSNQRSMGAVQH